MAFMEFGPNGQTSVHGINASGFDNLGQVIPASQDHLATVHTAVEVMKYNPSLIASGRIALGSTTEISSI